MHRARVALAARAYLWLPELVIAAAMILGALLFAGAVVAGLVGPP